MPAWTCAASAVAPSRTTPTAEDWRAQGREFSARADEQMIEKYGPGWNEVGA
ncbi:hypothetical protein [Deinococcus carri]|uniref:hypothetical protein n=1 Tax=Deinococcus carri TaxID=1211323 RepID=UPI0031EA06F8